MFHVTFPGIGLEFDIDRVAFSIGDMPIYWYGICIAAGLMLALLFAFWKARDFGIDSDRMVDVVFCATIIAVICARAFYVAFAPFEYESLWEMINLRDGGIAIYGAVIGAFVSGWALCKWRKVPVLPMFDVAAMGFLIGQACGRWGNFFNREAFGTNTTLPWGMYSEGTYNYLAAVQQKLAEQGVTVDPSLPVHPTFLYESLWCALGFVLLLAYHRRRKFEGEIFLMYLVWYGAERFFVEGLRTDSLESIGNIRVSQVIALVCVVVGVIVWMMLRRRAAGKTMMVNYIVADKRLDGPAVLSWPASEKAPSEKELKERIEALVAEQNEPKDEPGEKAEEDEPEEGAGPAETEAAEPEEQPAEETEAAEPEAQPAETADEPAAPAQETEPETQTAEEAEPSEMEKKDEEEEDDGDDHQR